MQKAVPLRGTTHYSCLRNSGLPYLSVGILSALRTYLIWLFAKVSDEILSDEGH